MTELETVRELSPPREDGTVRWLAGGFEPLVGFLLYGIVWFGLTVLVLAMMPRSVEKALGDAGPAIFGLAFLLSHVGLVAWIVKRRAGTRRLFRDGALIDARIGSVKFTSKRGVDATRVGFTFEAGGETRGATAYLFDHQRHLATGDALPVLFTPGHRYCAVFPVSGAPVAAIARKAS